MVFCCEATPSTLYEGEICRYYVYDTLLACHHFVVVAGNSSSSSSSNGTVGRGVFYEGFSKGALAHEVPKIFLVSLLLFFAFTCFYVCLQAKYQV